ncbi:hypothetical protein EV384_6157 [Micromonospora kangleipakensis]|uniref:Uncharacterized protein n=1 Tax=Micromonospora kangleipakensis TaxID=1077942 RepID=A0A4Q8BIS2_9ACTN|nr:hypothetical protein [Micromonospora kangleipakensis]RZU77435.1 hypothetical protein EV384_6157 [Micromonospora kangleipakensis]
MVRKVRRLLAAVTGALIATACSLALAATAHATAPKPAPAGVDITGDRLGQPLRLRADTRPIEVAAVVDQVSWLGRTGRQRGPEAKNLGPKYTVVVLAGGRPTRTYDLYPLAKGGPRVYRPAKQPDLSKISAGWFFGRLNMSETLRSVGVPLERQFDTVSGGVGGGERVIPEDSLNPARDIDDAVDELQRLLLLNVGVMLVITTGLAGIALLIRRRTR